jgi:hypothetical protein
MLNIIFISFLVLKEHSDSLCMDVFLYLDQIHAEIVWDLFETNEDFCLEFYHLN